MFFFGGGRKSREWPLPDGSVLALVYRYMHIWWIFRLSYGRKWFMLADQRSQDREVSPTEVQRMFPAGAPGLGIWESYGLLFLVGAVILFALIGRNV
jgi:hypothetical protein